MTSDVVSWLAEPLRYEFMQRAVLEVIITGAVTGTVGAYVVVRGLSFMGDALAHAVFPGIVIAFLLGHSTLLGALAFAMLTSVSIAVLRTSPRVKDDTAIGVLFAGTFALGVVLISASRNFARDAASFLFGNVLGTTEADLWLSTVIGGLVLMIIGLFYEELLLVSFDRLGAQAMGLPVFWLDVLLLLLISLTVVVSLRAVGNTLVVAMLVTPAAAARLLTDRFPIMIGLSAAFGMGAGVVGLFVSYHANLAAGGTIVLVATTTFAFVWLLTSARGMRSVSRRRPRAGARW